MNEGAGLGRLVGFAKRLVGRVLTWRNRPVYDELWKIIEDDLLAAVQERVPELAPRPTWFSETAAPHSFETPDGMCAGTVAGYKGGRVDWITTCKFFSSELGFGNLRIDGWATRETRAPHVAVHLCIVFLRSQIDFAGMFSDFASFFLIWFSLFDMNAHTSIVKFSENVF